MTYQVRTRVFEGPFDLLLHLISKREVDIYEVALGEITEDYLAYLQQMEDLDLELTTEFLVVAATLIEIKAARLLPGPPIDEEAALAISERDMLIARLLEYRAFKDAATAIAARLEENAGYIARSAGSGKDFEHLVPDVLARVSVERLAAIAERALTPRIVPVLDLSHITPIRISVAEAIAKVRHALAERKRVTFRELTADCGSRIDVVVRFLALLELYKRGEADVRQADTFGEIEVVGLSTAPSDGTEEIDEYEGGPA